MGLLIIQFLSSFAQTVGAQMSKKNRAKGLCIFGGLALVWVLQAVSAYQVMKKDNKLAYQEAVLKKVSEAELSRAGLAVKMEESKLTVLDGMRSELIERMRNEDSPAQAKAASPTAGSKP